MYANSKIKIVALLMSVFATDFAFGDLIPMFSEPIRVFPLHRIGIEFVLTTVAASLGGGLAMKWILKRGWKFEKDVSKEERLVLESKLTSVRPALFRCCVALRLLDDLGVENRLDQKGRVKLILRLNPVLAKELDGVPVEWVDSTIQGLYPSCDDGAILLSCDNGTTPLEGFCNGSWAAPGDESRWDSKEGDHESGGNHHGRRRWRISLYGRRMFWRRVRQVIFFMLILGIAMYLAWWLGQRF